MTHNISLPSNHVSGSFFGSLRILCFVIIDQQNSVNANLNNRMVSALSRLRKKFLVIRKVNNPAHLISETPLFAINMH